MTYTETQRFTQPWLWILVTGSSLIPAGIFGFGFYRQIIKGIPFGNHPMSDRGMIIAFAAMLLFSLLLILLFATVRLITRFVATGVSFRYIPFHWKFRTIPWTEIERWELVTYNPIGDYGGWGIRYGNAGRAYNVSGNKGLKLYLRNKKPLLIGTRHEEELRGFLVDLKKQD